MNGCLLFSHHYYLFVFIYNSAEELYSEWHTDLFYFAKDEYEWGESVNVVKLLSKAVSPNGSLIKILMIKGDYGVRFQTDMKKLNQVPNDGTTV